jgi:hypothetical protein
MGSFCGDARTTREQEKGRALVGGGHSRHFGGAIGLAEPLLPEA